jgi:hypothetical protein
MRAVACSSELDCLSPWLQVEDVKKVTRRGPWGSVSGSLAVNRAATIGCQLRVRR